MNRYVSFYDLMSCDDSREAITQDDFGALYDILFAVGFDINLPLDMEKDLCRSLQDNQLVTEGRMIGTERRDAEWMRSDMCSMENRIEQALKRDRGLGSILQSLNQQSNFTNDIINNMEMGGNF